MSRLLEIEKAAVDGGQLAEELLQVPGLAPVNNRVAFSLSPRPGGVTLEVPDGADEAAVRAAVASHTPRARETAADLRALWTTYKTNVQAASTVAQVKAVLVNDLGPLLRAIARGSRGDINGG